MRIVYVEIDNFRGIRKLRWAPNAKVNCLIGPGDSTKTTILDAIELALNPRSYRFADDSDFYDLDYDQPINIVVTVGGLPAEFSSAAMACTFAAGMKRRQRSRTSRPRGFRMFYLSA
jgi:putative ATP-dependent endonuclease of OLD family